MTIDRARVTLRLLGVGLLLVYACVLVGCVHPVASRRLRLRLAQRWSRRLLHLLGIGLRVSGTNSRPPLHGLLVANHISWLDVFVINAVRPATFVCKAEVRAWPLIGWLSRRSGVLFLQRGSRADARRAQLVVRERLAHGESVAVFPEGTTTDGSTLLPFSAALMQAAVDARCPVLPLALSYTDADGNRSNAVAYCGETSLWQSICSVAAASGIEARADILPSIAATESSRREIAFRARTTIDAALRPRAGDAGGERPELSRPPMSPPQPAAGAASALRAA